MTAKMTTEARIEAAKKEGKLFSRQDCFAKSSERQEADLKSTKDTTVRIWHHLSSLIMVISIAKQHIDIIKKKKLKAILPNK